MGKKFYEISALWKIVDKQKDKIKRRNKQIKNLKKALSRLEDKYGQFIDDNDLQNVYGIWSADYYDLKK